MASKNEEEKKKKTMGISPFSKEGFQVPTRAKVIGPLFITKQSALNYNYLYAVSMFPQDVAYSLRHRQ